MSTKGRQKDTKRSPEVYRNLSEPDPEIPRDNPKKGSSEGSLISDDFKLSWYRRVLFNLRSLNCFGKPLEQ